MDDGRTHKQRRCGKTRNRQVVDFGESMHFRQVGENNAKRGGDHKMLRGVYVAITTRDPVPLPHARWCQTGNENRDSVGTREMGSRVQCHMYRSPMATEAGSAEAGESCCA